MGMVAVFVACPLSQLAASRANEWPDRSLMSRMLQRQGYQLLEARTGSAALRLAANHSGPIDLLETEVVMPHMDGFTLGERLVEQHPGTRVLVRPCDRSVAVEEGAEATQPFLRTPFACDYLLQAIREQLAAAAQPCSGH